MSETAGVTVPPGGTYRVSNNTSQPMTVIAAGEQAGESHYAVDAGASLAITADDEALTVTTQR